MVAPVKAASAAEVVATERRAQGIVRGAAMEAWAVVETAWEIAAFHHRTLVDREPLEDPVVASAEVQRVRAANAAHRVWVVEEEAVASAVVAPVAVAVAVVVVVVDEDSLLNHWS